MIRTFLVCLAISLIGLSAHANSVVDKFECKESASTLRLKGVVTQSSAQPYRFFVAVETATGLKADLEARSVSGFDYDTMESVNGYHHSSANGLFLYEELSKAGRTRRVLTLEMPYLTGDKKSHTLTCKAL